MTIKNQLNCGEVNLTLHDLNRKIQDEVDKRFSEFQNDTGGLIVNYQSSEHIKRYIKWMVVKQIESEEE